MIKLDGGGKEGAPRRNGGELVTEREDGEGGVEYIMTISRNGVVLRR